MGNKGDPLEEDREVLEEYSAVLCGMDSVFLGIILLVSALGLL